MESQQTTMTIIERQIQIRGYRLLLELDSIDDILSFAMTYPGYENQALDILLDVLLHLHHHSTIGSSIADKDLVQGAITILHDAIANAEDDDVESANVESMASIQNENTLNFILGDYFFGPEPELDELIEQVGENDPTNCYGSPPASKRAIETLPSIKIKEHSSSSWQCVVCMEDMTVELKEMPCKHIYHRDCIIPWLELHNSCPLCRCQLPSTDDDDHHDYNNTDEP